MNINIPRMSLNLWALVFILLISLPILVGQYFLNYSFFRDIQTSHSNQRLEDIANKAQALLLFPVASSELSSVYIISDEMMKYDDEIKAIYIKNSQGDTIYHRESKDFIDKSDANIIRKEVMLTDSRPDVVDSTFDFDSVENGDIIYGKVILYLSKNQHYEIIAHQLNQRSLIFVILVFIITALVYLITMQAHKHAQRIHKHIQGLLRGEYKSEVKLSSVSEFIDLSLGLNELGDTLRKKIEALEVSNRDAVEAKDSAEKAAYFKDEFIHIISHEIRTPVNTVANLVDLMEPYLSTSNIDEVANRHYQVCKGAVGDLRGIIDELVNFDELEREGVEVNYTMFKPVDLFYQLTSNYNLQFKNKSISFLVTGPEVVSESDLVFCSDVAKLKQIIVNIIDNAYKYTNSGSVSIKWSIINDHNGVKYLDIHCQDSGIGIPDAYLGRIFEPFYQVQKKRYYSNSGNGLGLSIVKKLINTLNGTINVESKEKIGTTVAITVPLGKITSHSDLSAENNLKSLVKDDYTITTCVIDDDINSCYTLQAMLDQCGISCCYYTDTKRAIVELSNQPVDIIFIDLHMPSINGFEVARQIKESNKLTNIRMICVTADTHSSVNDAIESSAMDGLMFKPISMTELLKIVNSAEEANKYQFKSI